MRNGHEYKRPYHLVDEKENVDLRWRFYKHLHNAHRGAMEEARWAKVGVTIAIVNAQNARLLAQYTRHPTSIGFRGPQNRPEPKGE